MATGRLVRMVKDWLQVGWSGRIKVGYRLIGFRLVGRLGWIKVCYRLVGYRLVG